MNFEETSILGIGTFLETSMKNGVHLASIYILPFNGRMLKTEVLHNETGSEEFLKTLQDDKNYEIWCIKHFMYLFSPNPNYVKH